MRKRVKAFLRTRGYSIGRRSPDILDFLQSRDVSLVIDVGANVGQFALSLRELGYRGKIVSLEPVRHIFDKLEGTAARDPLWTTLNLALGSAEGSAEIHVSDDSRFSSFLTQTKEARLFDPRSRVTQREVVSVKRLEDILKDWPEERVFLKLDVQGFERDVLEGGAGSLERIVGLMVELPIKHLYEDTWSIHEALAYLQERRFSLAQATPTNYDAADQASMLEMDCVFRRDS